MRSCAQGIAAGLSLAGVLAGSAALAAQPELFDKPLAVMRQQLPKDPANPTDKAQVSCFTYQHFMVKEVDLGEVGAEQLSILPFQGAERPACRRENAANEKVIRAEDWSGYFRGRAKGDYVLFDGESVNGGKGFAVFGLDGRKLFDDVANEWRAAAVTPEGLSLGYRRAYAAPCSLMADAQACWTRIKADTGLKGDAPPDCRAAYERERKRAPKQAQQVLQTPSVLDYDVTVTTGASGRSIRPDTGKALACRLAE